MPSRDAGRLRRERGVGRFDFAVPVVMLDDFEPDVLPRPAFEFRRASRDAGRLRTGRVAAVRVWLSLVPVVMLDGSDPDVLPRPGVDALRRRVGW